MSTLGINSNTMNSSKAAMPLLNSELVHQTATISLFQTVTGLGLFYVLGRVMGNAHSKSQTTWLAILMLIQHANVVYQLIQQTVPNSTYSYLVASLFLQFSVAYLPSRSTQMNVVKINSGFDFLKPMIFACQTTHSRLFPTKHSFSYSYLFVGIPIGWEGTSGGLLSTGKSLVCPGLFTVDPDDYLARGSYIGGLAEKLKNYLSSQAIPADRYVHAYLVTAPRFLGFSFNPVSFWYLYDHEKKLSAMILEVNNTFDERRMYFMKADSDPSSSEKVFSTSWSKDFHVSPFNDRDGSYSLKAKDPTSDVSNTTVDNTIVLRDDSGRTKLIARVSSTGAGIDPGSMTTTGKCLFLAKWWWVGFLTNPRILREARTLWVKQLQVYYRPEVVKTSIGRSETLEEKYLETLFKALLTRLVKCYKCPVAVDYQAAAGPDRGSGVQIQSNSKSAITTSCPKLVLQVLTPEFYCEMVRYQTIDQAFTKLCFEAANTEAMLYASDHDMLRTLLRDYSTDMPGTQSNKGMTSSRQCLVSKLRSKDSRSMLAGCIAWLSSLEKSVKPSEFDLFVFQHTSAATYHLYLRKTQKVLLAGRVAFGSVWLLKCYGYLIRILCLVKIGGSLTGLWYGYGILRSMLSLLLFSAIVHSLSIFMNA